jgi:hypothetical protein
MLKKHKSLNCRTNFWALSHRLLFLTIAGYTPSPTTRKGETTLSAVLEMKGFHVGFEIIQRASRRVRMRVSDVVLCVNF